jgi:RNA polymerase sigma factor (sigma-70 family)
MFPGDESSGNTAQLGEAFVTTHWSQILTARDRQSPDAANALEALCRDYWRPLYAYIRRRGYAPEDAQDLTQSFFERLLAKNYLGDLTPGLGRFRSFLLASLKHFLANSWDHAHRKKRGGGQVFISIEECRAAEDDRLEPREKTTPETEFERRWATSLLDRVLRRLCADYTSSNPTIPFAELGAFLRCDQPPGLYAEVAHRTGIKEGTVKVAVYRLRRRYGALLREEIGRTVADPAEVEAELRHLIEALAE